MNTRTILLVSCCTSAMIFAGSAIAQQSPAPAPGTAGAPATETSAKNVIRSDAGARAAAVNQDTDAGSTSAVGDIIVTASRQGDTLQHTPVAITAFTDERRNLLGISTGRDITNLTPSMSLQGEYLSLRGIGRLEDPGQGADPGIAVHVDGVYTSSPAYLNQPDFLTDRIEIVRGPQSIFGRSSVGGTANIYSHRPTDEVHGDFRVGATTLDDFSASAALSGPITDRLKYRVAGSYEDVTRGVQENAGGGKRPGGGKNYIIEGQLEWNPTDTVNLWFRYQRYQQDLLGYYGIQTKLAGGTGLASPYQGNSALSANPYYGLAPNPQYGLAPGSNPSIDDKFATNVDDPGYVKINHDNTFTVNAKWELPGFEVKYVGGYSEYHYEDYLDIDYTSRKFFTSPGGNQVPSEYVGTSFQAKQWYSHELTLQSPSTNKIAWVVGAYDYWEKYYTTYAALDVGADYLAKPVLNLTTMAPAAPNPSRAFYSQSTRLNSQNQAIYGQIDWNVTDALKTTGAVRYNWDRRQVSDDFREIFDLWGFFGDFGVPKVGLDVTPAVHSATATRHGEQATGKVGVEWHPDTSLIAYANIAWGYKAGGYNLGAFAPIPQVKPETLTDYEAGIKKTFGRTLLVDASAFYYQYNNLQVPVTVGVASGAGGTLYQQTLASAQKARSYGLELETVWSPVSNVHLTLVYSYLNAKFQRFTNADPTGVLHDPASGKDYADLAGSTLPQSPRNKISLVPQYVAHLGNASLSLSATYSYVASQYYGVFNLPQYQGPSYQNVDLRAVYQPKNSHWTAILFARNVADTTQYIYRAPPASGIVPTQILYTVSEPRSFGVSLQYRF